MADLVFVALGSNLGDRANYLAGARTAIAAVPGTRIAAASAVEETAPFGPVPQGPYLNQMLALETTLQPAALLGELLRIERDAGRTRSVRWGPRTLDLDIVAYADGRRVELPGLTVPHPGLDDREFWQRELAEVRAVLASTTHS